MSELGKLVKEVEDYRDNLVEAEERAAEAPTARDRARSDCRAAITKLKDHLNLSLGKKRKAPAATAADGISAKLSPSQFNVVKAIDELGASTVADIADEIDRPPRSVSLSLTLLVRYGAAEKLANGTFALSDAMATRMRPEKAA